MFYNIKSNGKNTDFGDRFELKSSFDHLVSNPDLIIYLLICDFSQSDI